MLTPEELAVLEEKWRDLPNNLEMYQSEAIDLIQAFPQLIEMARRTAEAEQFCEQAHLSALHNESRVAPLDGKLMVATGRIAELERKLTEAKELADEARRYWRLPPMFADFEMMREQDNWDLRRAALDAAPIAGEETEQ